VSCLGLLAGLAGGPAGGRSGWRAVRLAGGPAGTRVTEETGQAEDNDMPRPPKLPGVVADEISGLWKHLTVIHASGPVYLPKHH
jgi:hypothetical protein